MTDTTIDPQLLGRFDVPTPRYTSYPTALAFEPMDQIPTERVYTVDAPVSLYFHMIYCRSLCWYCACTKTVTRDQSKGARYVDRLLRELDLRTEQIGDRPVVQLHLGGGTPTFFTAEELATLARTVRANFDVAPDAEFSVEIDPRELSDEQVSALAEGGFSRASLGVQDHNPAVQTAIHREQPYEMTANAVERLRKAGIGAINFDLVYGLPFQTPESFRRTVADVAALAPDRLAVYSYAHVPWAAPAQKLLTRRTELPGADAKIAMFVTAAEELADAGYDHIGMDHFATPDDALSQALRDGTLRRNFMGYTTHRGVDIHGFGASAISQTPTTYFQNERELGRWEQRIDAGETPTLRGLKLGPEDRLRRDAIMSVMCSNGLDLATIGDRYGIDGATYFAGALAALDELAVDGLVEREGTRVRVTRKGRFLVRNIARVFDANQELQGFSKAI